MKTISYNEFSKKFHNLSEANQFIVFQTLFRMKHSKKHINLNITAFNRISEKQHKQNITYTKLYKELNKKLNNSVSKKTYESFLKRKSMDSELFKVTCEILNIPENEIQNINLQIQAQDMGDMKWLFTSLSREDQLAISQLATYLKLAEDDIETFSKEIRETELGL